MKSIGRLSILSLVLLLGGAIAACDGSQGTWDPPPPPAPDSGPPTPLPDFKNPAADQYKLVILGSTTVTLQQVK